MTSGVKDWGYSKSGAIKLALNKPHKARTSASTYVYFAMENGFTLGDYRKYTTELISSKGIYDKDIDCYNQVI